MVVCYGLGSTYESWNARHQLAFLVLLAEAYEAQSIQLHDPFLSKDELEALEALGIEQAQPPRSAKPYHGARSLYFMPHCPAQIYADVLKGFAQALDELLIVGNSFLSYAKRRIGDDLHPGIPRPAEMDAARRLVYVAERGVVNVYWKTELGLVHPPVRTL